MICFTKKSAPWQKKEEQTKRKNLIHKDTGFQRDWPWSFAASERYFVCLSWNVVQSLIHVHSTKSNSLAPFFRRVTSSSTTSAPECPRTLYDVASVLAQYPVKWWTQGTRVRRHNLRWYPMISPGWLPLKTLALTSDPNQIIIFNE